MAFSTHVSGCQHLCKWLVVAWNSGFRGSYTSSASTSCVDAYTQIQSSALATGTRKKALAHFSLAHFSACPKCKMGRGIVMKTEGSKDAVSVTGEEGTWNKGERVPIPGSPPSSPVGTYLGNR